MKTAGGRVVLAAAAILLCLAAQPTKPHVPAPVIVVETSRGTFSFVTYPDESPRTVMHIVGLVRSGFYDGQRFHRAVPGFVIQWGDPQSRNLSQEAVWGRGSAASSGQPIGVSEITKKHTHVAGAVGIAHPGNPSLADSQIYVTLSKRDDLDSKYTVFGHLVSGHDVVDAIRRGDVIRRMYVQE